MCRAVDGASNSRINGVVKNIDSQLYSFAAAGAGAAGWCVHVYMMANYRLYIQEPHEFMARHSEREPSVCHATHERARYMLEPIDIIQQISPVPTIKNKKKRRPARELYGRRLYPAALVYSDLLNALLV